MFPRNSAVAGNRKKYLMIPARAGLLRLDQRAGNANTLCFGG
jgi:hypothetical protein